MTNPKSTAERLTEIETRLAAIDTRLAALVAPDAIHGLVNRVTAIEGMLKEKVPGFEAVGTRVSELSGAFQQANQRLTGLETAIEEIRTAAPPPSGERLKALEEALSALSGTVSTMQATRGRTGLSGRLRSIEEKLDALKPPIPPEAP